jgi:hypothetical protein
VPIFERKLSIVVVELQKLLLLLNIHNAFFIFNEKFIMRELPREYAEWIYLFFLGSHC